MKVVKNIFIVIVIIGLLGVIGYCGYRIYDRLNGNTTEPSKTEENKKEEKKDVTPAVGEEKELKDDLIKQDILNKINMLLGLKFESPHFELNNRFTKAESINKLYFGFLLPASDEIKKLDNNQKLQIALYNVGSGIYTNSGNEVRKEIKIDTLKQMYYELFKEDLNQFNDVCISWYCYNYDQTKNVYNESSKFKGGVGGAGNISYINAINYVNDFVYVYINFGSYEVDFQGGGNKCYVVDGVVNYDDKMNYDNPIFVGKYGTDNTTGNFIYECEHFKIDETNYTNFTNYKFVFKKNDNGNYYFYSVEKVD